jgi:hypothetical protein
VATCGALAALTQAAVEARMGAAGIALWQLARGEDRRVVFRHAVRERPSASLDWTEFELRDPAPLVFAAAGLVAQLCDALAARGEAARTLRLTFALGGGGRVVRRVRSARETADPAVWRRLVRAVLERIGTEGDAPPGDAPPAGAAHAGGAGAGSTGRGGPGRGADGGPAGGLPDGVVGLALAVEAARPAEAPQADLFDRGAASAAAASGRPPGWSRPSGGRSCGRACRRTRARAAARVGAGGGERGGAGDGARRGGGAGRPGAGRGGRTAPRAAGPQGRHPRQRRRPRDRRVPLPAVRRRPLLPQAAPGPGSRCCGPTSPPPPPVRTTRSRPPPPRPRRSGSGSCPSRAPSP